MPWASSAGSTSHLTTNGLWNQLTQRSAVRHQYLSLRRMSWWHRRRSTSKAWLARAPPCWRCISGLRVAAADATVLIQGESGTGKELVAQSIHRRSVRASRAFVTVNVAAVPDSLFEDQLFGHEAGAFTDARTTVPGLLDRANGGVLFFDEIGELPLSSQAKLLRVLEDRQFYRLGGHRAIPLDVRVVAATNRDLKPLWT